MPLEMKKSDANNVDSLKEFISRTLNMNLHGWELYIDMQPVTISISSYIFGCIVHNSLQCSVVLLPFAVIAHSSQSVLLALVL